MYETALELFVFSAKTLILVVFILLLIAGILALLGRGKDKRCGRIAIKNLNQKYAETTEQMLHEILPKKQFKKFLKEKKSTDKLKKKLTEEKKNIYILNFHGDIKASAVNALREEVTAVLGIAKPKDEILVKIESAGGMVHAYGLATSQLERIRQRKIPLVVAIDKVAASGGYLMATVADKILSAPFAIIGSIGVIVQLPNFHRLLKEKQIDFEQLTAGNFKRTLTLFGHNTIEGREKLQEEIDEIHDLFKHVIQTYRKDINVDKVATGEHWLAQQAIDLKLVDELMTSDEYLLKASQDANLFEIAFLTKKSLLEKFTNTAAKLKSALFNFHLIH